MRNDEIVLAMLTAFASGLMGYLFYLARRIKILDRRIELHAEALEASRHSARPSPAE